MSSQYIFTTYKLSRRFPPDKEVLSDISLSFLPGAKIGVLGYNGAGKSTLLRIMAGLDTEFDGHAQLAPGATVGLLEQEPQLDPAKDVRGNIEDGVAHVKALLDRFNELSMNYSEETADEFARVQEQIDATDGWNLDTTLEIAMDALRTPPATRRSPTSRAASAAVWPWPACCSPSPTCSCSTSPPTTSTPSRWPGSSATCATTRARSWRSPTIATSSTTSPAGSSSSTAAGGSPTRATTPAGSSRSASASSRRPGRRARASARSTRSSSGSASTRAHGATSRRRA